MATSITQAKPLLTAAELELFDQSRAEPVKAFTAKQLASKEKRTRALRDKYRDLYRRQTVAQRGKVGKSGARGKAMPATDAAGKSNARTQRKGEIMQEMLERFEARSALLEERARRESTGKPAKTGKGAARKSAKPAAKKKASAPARTAPVKATAKPQKAAAKTAAKAKAPAAAKGKSKAPTKAPVKAPAKAMLKSKVPAKTATKTSAKPGLKTSVKAQPEVNTAVKTAKVSATRSASGPAAVAKRSATSAGKPKKTETPLSAVGSLGASAGAASSGVHIDHLTGQDPTERSHKAPSDMAPTHGGKAHAPDVNAPLDMVPAARRGNPVRNMPGNIAIQGHVSSSVRRAQGKKDSR